MEKLQQNKVTCGTELPRFTMMSQNSSKDVLKLLQSAMDIGRPMMYHTCESGRALNSVVGVNRFVS